VTIQEAFTIWCEGKLPETAVILGITVLWWGRIGILLVMLTFPLMFVDIVNWGGQIEKARKRMCEALHVSNVKAIDAWLSTLLELRAYGKSLDTRRLSPEELNKDAKLDRLSKAHEQAGERVQWWPVWIGALVLLLGIVLVLQYVDLVNSITGLFVLLLLLLGNLWEAFFAGGIRLLRWVGVPASHLMSTRGLRFLVWGLGLVGTFLALVVS